MEESYGKKTKSISVNVENKNIERAEAIKVDESIEESEESNSDEQGEEYDELSLLTIKVKRLWNKGMSKKLFRSNNNTEKNKDNKLDDVTCYESMHIFQISRSNTQIRPPTSKLNDDYLGMKSRGGQVVPLSTCLSNFDRADFELAWCLLIWPGSRLVFWPCHALSGATLSGQACPLSSLLE
ncbi:unnamed protein product [Lupinus luteus]|uniref:Uncharacterized protein n=1 Tax=Lupinus luteus TaxID=3873 RepID=A0AAV1YNB4_LUPLU